MGLQMAPVAVRTRPLWSVRGYVALTKPRIIELLLVTTVPPMLLAQRGLPSLLLIITTLVGGTLTAASANTINCYIDRDIDAIMRRTRRRPLVTGTAEISPPRALVFGLGARRRRHPDCSGSRSTGWRPCWRTRRCSSTCSSTPLGLKRRTSANIVIGGAAGCFPVLIGWAAVTGRVGLPAATVRRRRVLLDATAFLGAGDPIPRRLRGRRCADAAGGRERQRRHAQNPAVQLPDRRRVAAIGSVRGLAVRRLRDRRRGLVPRRGPSAAK